MIFDDREGGGKGDGSEEGDDDEERPERGEERDERGDTPVWKSDPEFYFFKEVMDTKGVLEIEYSDYDVKFRKRVRPRRLQEDDEEEVDGEGDAE